MAGTRKHWRGRTALALLLVFAFVSVSLAGCGGQRKAAEEGRQAAENPDQRSADRQPAPSNDNAEQQSRPSRAIVKFDNIDNRKYVDAKKMAGLIGFHAEFSEDGKSLLIGDHDVFLTITAGSREVVKEERPLTMSRPAILADDRLLVPSNELKKLFGDEALFTVDAMQAVIFPRPENEKPAKSADFADDPAGASWNAKSLSITSASSVADVLIEEAKRYLGVKYKFGAAEYSQSQRFDCSSYTRYLYGKQGINLPRTARAQAELGVEVPRDKLQRGDLLFFSVPGRFKSDKTPGHVGIYIGDQKMIHSSPLPEDGVQITDINKPYWKENFLFAKRVL